MSMMQSEQFKAHARLEESHWWFRGRRKILTALLKAIAAPSRDVCVVDVGCGTGGNTHAFSQIYSCVGIDPSMEAIAFAKSRFPGIRFVAADVFTLPEEISTADMVLLLDVLEHVKDDFAFVSGLLSLMKPGAHLVMAAPNDPSLWGPHDKAFEHYRRYTPERFRMLWKGLPVTERLLTCCNSRLYPLAKFIRGLTRLKGKAIGEGNTDISLPTAPVNRLLTSVFAGERRRIVAAMDGKGAPYKTGVSVLAVLRREEGAMDVRTMPKDIRDAAPWRD